MFFNNEIILNEDKTYLLIEYLEYYAIIRYIQLNSNSGHLIIGLLFHQ